MPAFSKCRPDVGYVVMPPGHGKSYYHVRIQDLIEADSLYNCRGDESLKDLRLIARTTGEWAEYDDAWASRLVPLIPLRCCIILVPSATVGDAIGATHLGSVQLSDSQWATNLENRGKTVADYAYARLSGPGVAMFHTNFDLQSWLLAKLFSWKANWNISD